MFINGKQVVFKNNQAVSVYDENGYAVSDDALLKTAQEKLISEHGGKQNELDRNYNSNSLYQGFLDL